MRKITFLCMLFLLTWGNFTNAQNCTIDHPSITSVPDTGIMLPLPLPAATMNVAYQQSVTIGVPSKVVYSAMDVPLNWLKINHVESKIGNTWTVLNSTGGSTYDQWSPLTWQCVTLTGTPIHSGIDSITVFVDAEVVVMSMAFPVSNQPGGKLPLLINDHVSIGAEYIDNNISVFPNPSHDGNFVLNTDQSFTMTICDITGRIISSSSINQGTTTLNLNDQPAGVYFVRLSNDSQNKTIRIVKR